jgi:hypothetical protein
MNPDGIIVEKRILEGELQIHNGIDIAGVFDLPVGIAHIAHEARSAEFEVA